MLQILTSAIISFIVAFLAIPVVMLIADKKKLYDIPDERKIHHHAIASLGGVAVFLALTFSSLLSIDFFHNPEFQYFLAAIFLLFFVGLKDDIVLLSAFKKLVVQIVAAAIIIHLGGIKIDNLYGIANIYAIEPVYGIPLTYTTILLIINAFNLIDGIDGLAGSLGFMASLLLGTYFGLSGMFSYAAISFSLAASLFAFLIFNFHPAKIFMGDSGSLLIGIVSSILVLKFINVASNPTSAIPLASAVAIGVSIILIPLVDTIRVFSIRIFKGRSPFTPDRNHVHHLLLQKGFGHASITLLCVAANILLIAGVYFSRYLGNTILMFGLFSISFLVLGVLYFTAPKEKLVLEEKDFFGKLPTTKPASKVIDLSTKERVAAENIK